MPTLSCSAVRERKTPSLTGMCTHLSRNRRDHITHEVWVKNVCLVAITSTSPNSKVSETASKLVPRKEKMARGFKIISNQLSVLRC